MEPHVSLAGELLPLDVAGAREQMLAWNILRDIDCVDPSSYDPDELELYPNFLAHRLPESGFFTDSPARHHGDLRA